MVAIHTAWSGGGDRTEYLLRDHLGSVSAMVSATGRFLSADPIVQFAESTQGLDRYQYVGNNG